MWTCRALAVSKDGGGRTHQVFWRKGVMPSTPIIQLVTRPTFPTPPTATSCPPSRTARTVRQQRPQRRPRFLGRVHCPGQLALIIHIHFHAFSRTNIRPSCPSCSQNSSPRAIASKVRVSRSTCPACLLQLVSFQGLAFHPTQPLLAAALHNGSVQLWNYRMGVLVDRFEEHEGTFTLFNAMVPPR